MSEEPLDRIVLRYLQKRGYTDAERALRTEAKIASVSQMALVPHLGADASIADHILYYNEADSDPEALMEGYRLLREWTHHSLDLYKVRVRSIRSLRVGHPRARKNNNPKCARSERGTRFLPPATPSALVAAATARVP